MADLYDNLIVKALTKGADRISEARSLFAKNGISKADYRQVVLEVLDERKLAVLELEP